MNQKGAVIVIVAALMFAFIGIAAVALDLTHLYLVRNELQNAADAGALAGVRVLYNPDGFVNPTSNITARNAAMANQSEKLAVEVIPDEVERGHWSFADKTFTPNDTLTPVTLSPPYSFSDLDSNPAFVNAIRIVTRRGGGPENIQATSFFARIWGYFGFNVQANAIAYIGFSQAIEPQAVDVPIAICLQAVTQNGTLSCITGRMINSNGSGVNTNTGGWTNYSQGEDCNQPSANDMNSIFENCAGGNSSYILAMSTIGVSNGMQDSTFEQRVDSFRNCWKRGENDLDGDGTAETPLLLDPITGYPIQSWRIRLPLIDCGDEFGPINGCRPNVVVRGTIQVDVVWVSQTGNDPHYQNIPTRMDDWSCSGSNVDERKACWNSFVSHFQLTNYNAEGGPAPYLSKSIYIKPVCTQYVGPNSGASFSFFWQNPVLVN